MTSHSDYTRPGVEPWWESSPITGDHTLHASGDHTLNDVTTSGAGS
jgi:hypothetical protein